jgi:PAS domain S-box-containing protein
MHTNPVRSEHEQFVAQFYSLQNTTDASVLLSIWNSEGKITYVNENFCTLSGYSLRELIGQPHSFLLTPNHTESVTADMKRVFARGRVWKGVLQCKDKKGKTQWVSALISPVLDDAGTITRYISIWKLLAAQVDTSAA